VNAVSPRNLPQLLADAQAAGQRAAIATRSWPAFMPSTPAVDELANTIEGLKRTLCELRPHTMTLRSEA
jgi:hypothetical protein